MCKLGDIIVINEFKGEDDISLTKHSFIVVDDEHGEIKGLDYDFAAPIMSSFQDDKHKEKILSYKVNKEITNDDTEGNFQLKKPSYIKANKLYYFNKEKIDYNVLARVKDEFLDELMKLILTLDEKDKLSIITTNLRDEEKENVQ